MKNQKILLKYDFFAKKRKKFCVLFFVQKNEEIFVDFEQELIKWKKNSQDLENKIVTDCRKI